VYNEDLEQSDKKPVVSETAQLIRDAFVSIPNLNANAKAPSLAAPKHTVGSVSSFVRSI